MVPIEARKTCFWGLIRVFKSKHIFKPRHIDETIEGSTWKFPMLCGYLGLGPVLIKT